MAGWIAGRMGTVVAVLLLCGVMAGPVSAQPPAAVARGAAEAQADCRGAGGRPSLMQNFETQADLNGDGQPDYLHDLSRLDCAGAASFFCGSAGCPLIVYLSSPGGYRVQGLGHVQGWSLEQGGALPVLRLATQGPPDEPGRP